MVTTAKHMCTGSSNFPFFVSVSMGYIHETSYTMCSMFTEDFLPKRGNRMSKFMLIACVYSHHAGTSSVWMDLKKGFKG